MLKLIYLFACSTVLISCDSEQRQAALSKQRTGSTPSGTDTFFIHLDTANVMRSSYLVSISSDTSAALQSWNVDADALRSYLADASIKEVNIALAHTMGYIDNGNYGVPAGLSAGALSIVLTGVAANGNKVNYNTSYVLNRARPCPPVCDISATTK